MISMDIVVSVIGWICVVLSGLWLAVGAAWKLLLYLESRKDQRGALPAGVTAVAAESIPEPTGTAETRDEERYGLPDSVMIGLNTDGSPWVLPVTIIDNPNDAWAGGLKIENGLPSEITINLPSVPPERRTRYGLAWLFIRMLFNISAAFHPNDLHRIRGVTAQDAITGAFADMLLSSGIFHGVCVKDVYAAALLGRPSAEEKEQISRMMASRAAMPTETIQ